MSRVDNLSGRINNSTRIDPIASSPTQYPTYLGTTYLPTYHWSTYAPVASRAKGIKKKNHRQHERKHNIHHQDNEHITTTSHPSKSPTVTIAPPTTTENKHIPPNLTETPTTKDRNSGDTVPKPSTSRPSSGKPVDAKIAHTPPPTQERLQETKSPTQSPTIMPTRSSTEVPTSTPVLSISSSKRWSGPSRGRPFSHVRTPSSAATEVKISSQEPTGAPSNAPFTTQEPSNRLTRTVDDNISLKADEIDSVVEPDKTIKVNLSFRVKENPNYSSNGERRYKIYGQGQDDDEFSSAPTKFPSGSAHEPTSFPTYYPTKRDAGDARIPTLLPSYVPTRGYNENIKVRSDDSSLSMYQKRTCPGYSHGLDPTSETEEQEVLFAFGIQTTDGKSGQSIETSVEMIQLWILEDVASNLLHCPNDGSIGGRFILGRQYDGFENAVSRVFYMENDSTTSLSECTPTYGDATDCAIIQSVIYVTAGVDNTDSARKNTISVIKDRFESGSYVQGTIIYTTYLGPDVDELTMVGDSSKEKAGEVATSNNPTLTLFYVAIGVVFLAGCALAACLAMMMRVRKGRKTAASAFVPGHRHSKLPTDDLFVDSYPPSFRNSHVFQ